MPDNSYSVYSEFDIKKHKETFVNYLEVVVDENGKVMYAVPSHTEKLIAILQRKFQKSREQIIDMCPQSMYFDYMTWLCDTAQCCVVWSDSVRYPSTITQAQEHALQQLRDEGLLKDDRYRRQKRCKS